MKLLFLLLFTLLLPYTYVFGQKQLVFVDYATEKPIPNLNVRYPKHLLVTDELGKIVIPDSVKKLTVSGINYELRQVACAAFDTIYMFSKPVVYKSVLVKGPDKKLKLERKRVTNHGNTFKTSNIFFRFSLNQFSNGNDFLRFRFDERKLIRIPETAKIKLIIKSVNKNWEDTATVLSTLSEFQLLAFNKFENTSKYVPDQLLLEKEFPLNTVKEGLFEIGIDSIARMYNEVFVCIGIVNWETDRNTLMKNGAVFRSANRSISTLAIESSSGWKQPYLIHALNNPDLLELGKLLTPYCELVKGVNKKGTK